MTAHEVTDKQIAGLNLDRIEQQAKAVAAAFGSEGLGRSIIGDGRPGNGTTTCFDFDGEGGFVVFDFMESAPAQMVALVTALRAALAARQVPEDVAALVARLERKYDFYKQVHGKGEHETMVLLREAAAALEVSSRTVAPNREALLEWARDWHAPDGMIDSLLDADLWQPAPVIDRDALAAAIREQASGGQYQMPGDALPYEAWSLAMADALLASGWQPASPRTVTTVEDEWEYGYTSKWGDQTSYSLDRAKVMAANLRRRIASGAESGDLNYHGRVIRRHPAAPPSDWVLYVPSEGVESA